MVRDELFLFLTPEQYCGQNKVGGGIVSRCETDSKFFEQHIVAYSISQGRIVNFVAFATDPEKDDADYGVEWVAPCTKKEVVDCFADWEPEAVELLEAGVRNASLEPNN